MEKTKSQIKAAKSFNFQCKKASKCRHQKYQANCLDCKHLYKCEIQQKLETARSKM